MARSAAYAEGFREASKLAVAILHEQAQRMNDPSARAALNSTAHTLGIVMKAKLNAMNDQPDA